jgi:hypothetical protein
MNSDPKGTAMSASQLQTSVSVAGRELASRQSDGLHVLLLWHPRDNTLIVSIEDARAKRFLPARDRA